MTSIREELSPDIRLKIRFSYATRRVPAELLTALVGLPAVPQPGDLVLAQLEKVGKNASLELTDGRRCSLHEGDLLALVFGNRYATRQFEGYARRNGDYCDLLSMGGVCGLVASKHSSLAEPTKLKLLGAFANTNNQPLSLRQFALAKPVPAKAPFVIAVCGTSMDSGKTYTAMSLILGLKRQGVKVMGVKLTGTATGTDRWNMLDAGCGEALDFVDGGYPSTYMCSLEELLDLNKFLLEQAAALGAEVVVLEIADGVLQRETAALLQSSCFKSTINGWVLAVGDSLGAVGALSVLSRYGIEPLVISGVATMSPLGIAEITAATQHKCMSAKELQAGELNTFLLAKMKKFQNIYNSPPLSHALQKPEPAWR